MTTLYKPVLIETAEQAEALPKGVVAIRVDGLNEPGYGLARKDHGPGEDEFWYFPDAEDAGWNEDAIGWTALVPIEAEEETTALFRGFAGVFHVSRSTGSFPTPQRRLVTPWTTTEEA